MTALEELSRVCRDLAQRFVSLLGVTPLAPEQLDRMIAASLTEADALRGLCAGLITADETAGGVMQLLHVEILTAAGLPLDYPGPARAEEVLALRRELADALSQYAQQL